MINGGQGTARDSRLELRHKQMRDGAIILLNFLRFTIYFLFRTLVNCRRRWLNFRIWTWV